MCGLLDDDGDDDAAEPPDDEADAADPEETGTADDQAADRQDVDHVTDGETDGEEGETGDEAGDGDDEPELDVEDTLKDLAARMSRISSHIEGLEEDREQMEDKIDDVENQLGKLGNLAEVVSSQYNPFVAESAPSDPEWDPMERDIGGGGDVPEADHRGPDEERGREPDEGDLVLEEEVLEEATPPEGDREAEEAPAQDDPDPPGRDGDGGDESLFDTDADPLLEDPFGTAPGQDGPPDPAALDLEDAPDPTLTEEDAFDRNVLLLEWVGFMLERVGRDGLLDLLEYYESLGWLDDATKNRALRVATGIDVEEEGDRPRDWRGDTDLHERTLVVLERLAGRERPTSRLEELQLDLERLFDR